VRIRFSVNTRELILAVNKLRIRIPPTVSGCVDPNQKLDKNFTDFIRAGLLNFIHAAGAAEGV
jgi:hypothetical protein